jgi:hypothetical protein
MLTFALLSVPGRSLAMIALFEYLERHPRMMVGTLIVHTAVLVGLVLLVVR